MAITINLPPALHHFVRLALGDPAVQARLGAVIEADAFVAEAVRTAAEHSVPLDPNVLSNALQPDLIGMGRFAAAPIDCDGWPPSGWLPTRSVPSGGAPAFDWLWLASGG